MRRRRRCASAGELTFSVHENSAEVIEATNQSTGYCPEPESWAAVEPTLDEIKIKRPQKFTAEFIFRLCDKCNSKSIVRDDFYECPVCGADLNREWNFGERV